MPRSQGTMEDPVRRPRGETLGETAASNSPRLHGAQQADRPLLVPSNGNQGSHLTRRQKRIPPIHLGRCATARSGTMVRRSNRLHHRHERLRAPSLPGNAPKPHLGLGSRGTILGRRWATSRRFQAKTTPASRRQAHRQLVNRHRGSLRLCRRACLTLRCSSGIRRPAHLHPHLHQPANTGAQACRDRRKTAMIRIYMYLETTMGILTAQMRVPAPIPRIRSSHEPMECLQHLLIQVNGRKQPTRARSVSRS